MYYFLMSKNKPIISGCINQFLQQYYMDLSQHRSRTKNVVIQPEIKPSIFKRICRGMCPCMEMSEESILTTRASFLSDQKEDNTELTEMNSIVQVPIPQPIQEGKIETKPTQKFKSTFEKGSSPKKTYDLIPHRSSSEIKSSNHPIMHFREMEMMTIGDSKIKMLAKITSNRFVPSKQAIHKTKLIANKKEISLFANPEFDEFSRSRYLFFQKFDKGIKIDKQSWFNTIPEIVAEYIATKAKCTTILDGLCGVGSTAIKFANTCHTVLANDPDEDKLYCFDNNANIYGADNIIKHNKEFLELKGINADVVFLHPKLKNSLDQQLTVISPATYFTPSLEQLLTKSFTITNNVIVALPGNTDIEELGIIYHNALKRAQGSETSSCSIQIEKIFFNKKLKYVVVYYGPLVNRSVTVKQELSFIYKILNEGKSTPFRYKNVVKHIRSRYGMVELLYLTSECLKYEKETLMDRFFEMIRVNQLLSEKLLTNLMKTQQLTLQKQSTFEQEKYDQENYQKQQEEQYHDYERNSSDRTTSFITDEGDNIHFNKDQLIRETIIINPNRKSQTLAVSFSDQSDISRGSLDKTKFHQNL